MTPLSDDMNFRRATLADLDVIMHHRRSMFFEMGYSDEGALAAMKATSEPFFAKGLANGSYVGWLAEHAGKRVIAGGGLIVFEYHSSPADPSPKRPVIVNMYTDPGYRRIGIARELMKIMVGWCRNEGFGSVLLHASEDGRRLYESLGFKPTNEMSLMLR
ncbi:MAG TPA: GNAT family N-acetyltransferase [Bacteroidota bacterium]|jgi:GNAT superfamily N-acetyltransferase|nr:GNAT family N-acetyltransferase [Bacteroidota bacterium]